VDPTTDKLNKMQRQNIQYQADPNYVHIPDRSSIDSSKLKNQSKKSNKIHLVIELRDKYYDVAPNVDDLQLKQSFEHISLA
jgi:hypothetical protein